ncbi:MAG: HAD-IA family hydrolase [Muribaculaceae bacterium]|nr:HAD-IA family hydrolase [Muribaculaceae bacterium]
MKDLIALAKNNYTRRTGHTLDEIQAVLFDMDGILYDSMPGHARAWKMMCDSVGIEADENEFFAYEGRTGADTINILYQRQYHHAADAETCKRLYDIKADFFKSFGEPKLMPGAKDTVDLALNKNLECVLVTGSGQASILSKLNADFGDAFSLRVTAHDVKRGKPDPEPYLTGINKANTHPSQAIAIDNAPLGVESASKAGIFTIGVITGPLKHGALLAAGADIEVNSMAECRLCLALLTR